MEKIFKCVFIILIYCFSLEALCVRSAAECYDTGLKNLFAKNHYLALNDFTEAINDNDDWFKDQNNSDNVYIAHMAALLALGKLKELMQDFKHFSDRPECEILLTKHGYPNKKISTSSQEEALSMFSEAIKNFNTTSEVTKLTLVRHKKPVIEIKVSNKSICSIWYIAAGTVALVLITAGTTWYFWHKSASENEEEGTPKDGGDQPPGPKPAPHGIKSLLMHNILHLKHRDVIHGDQGGANPVNRPIEYAENLPIPARQTQIQALPVILFSNNNTNAFIEEKDLYLIKELEFINFFSGV